ncbi:MULTISPECIES: helix-turn-helix domain-containing protein [Proteus]|uniref:helix-turn-helix domain-containing protein n=1 Tax=Proteus TaxID=583 RepID=UPI00131FA813|nr:MULTISPECIES: helix-turn-helix transcriptional regulator [Proteus]MBI6406927.1 helix-turn-helix transcriptional regulator [Proteus sp. PR00208]MDM3562671.1 helix-turn-helix transcriptional regulator [Proteus vulgaris]QHD95133.1 helix-turn-helix domain-containing protein [Proteus terrae subsp. cibarius]QJW50465.1 helix-turn-helix transcriptional regulator [Proteus terrae subsp. cibarius]
MITKRLKEARLMAGLSQEKLGILAGIDEASASARMNQYEKGKHTPDFNTVMKLAKVLNIPVPFFYTDDSQLAEIIITYSLLTENNKKELINKIKNLINEK